MKKLVSWLVVACGLAATPALAQTVNYACQYVKMAGLNWENGSWVTGTFNNMQPFILTAVDKSLTPVVSDEAGDDSHPLQFATCLEPKESVVDIVDDEPILGLTQTCVVGPSVAVVFDFDNLTGVYSFMSGGTGPRNASRKDSLAISPFVCQTIK